MRGLAVFRKLDKWGVPVNRIPYTSRPGRGAV